MGMRMYRTTEEALAAVDAELTRRQCAEGRHVAGCPHRPLPEWVARALGKSTDPLPAKARWS